MFEKKESFFKSRARHCVSQKKNELTLQNGVLVHTVLVEIVVIRSDFLYIFISAYTGAVEARAGSSSMQLENLRVFSNFRFHKFLLVPLGSLGFLLVPSGYFVFL